MTYALMDPEEIHPWRRAAGLGWVAIWLVFLGSPLEHVWQHNNGLARVVGAAAVIVFAALYLVLFAMARVSWREPRRADCAPPIPARRLLSLLGALALLIVVALPFAEQSTL